MIVACSSCSARFRVADEKVGPRGARIRCTRCGQTFAVSPAQPPTPVPVAPPEPPATTSEATGTGGWPTGILEVPGTPAADIGTPPALSLEGDPFATFAGAEAGSGFLASRSVTNLSDLERTGAVPIAARDPLEPDTSRDGGLSLEEGTKAAMPLRDGTPRWDEPEATSAVAVGPDGFQEVDLAAGAAPPDPDFDPLDPEPIPAAPAQRTSPREATPRAVALGTETSSPSSPPAPSAAPESPGPSPAPAQPRAPRFRALAMNVLSLAALLIVTVGILVWWRGEGIGSILRWPGSAQQRDVEVGQVSSGEYQGARGRPVLFVRGVVRATRAPVEGPVAVRVELVRAGATVGVATGAAGALPSPEQLAGIASAEDLDRMRAELLASAPARLEPGRDLPFLVILPRPDGDVGAVHFRVEPVLPPGR